MKKFTYNSLLTGATAGKIFLLIGIQQADTVLLGTIGMKMILLFLQQPKPLQQFLGGISLIMTVMYGITGV